MDASFVCRHSVFDLISKLAALLLQDEHAQTEKADAYTFVPEPAAVSKRRTAIYESLLRIHAYQICPRLDRFPQCKKLLDEQRDFFDAQLVNDITYCLIKVSKPPKVSEEIIKFLRYHEVDRFYRTRLLFPLPFRLEENHCRPGPQNTVYGSPVIFESIEDLRSQMKPIQFHRSTNIILGDFNEMKKPLKSAMKTTLLSDWLSDSIARMNEFAGGTKPMKTNFPAPPEPKKEPKKDAKKDEDNKKYPDKHFLSDVCMTNELKWHQDRTIELSFIKMIDFIDHLKKASAGLQSESFLMKPDGFFELRANSTIETVLPEVLADYSHPFLECGLAYRRLIACTQWNYSPGRIERPMNRTMRQAIIKFLSNSRLFLLSQPAKNLSQLVYSAAPTMQLLLLLDQMFRTERRLKISVGTSGACLLSVIWSAIDDCVNIQYLQFLIYLLRSLCETYCGQLQRWLYHGVLDEPFNEIFVGTQRALDEKSKEFFDRAHFVHPNMVPGFLAGCEPAIIQCGKYSHLLKSYNPQHILFTTKPPNLVVCLSQDELTDMQQKLELHYKQLLEQLNPFCMQSLIEERTASRFRFGNRMWSCTQERIADWKENQRELLIKANEGKQRRYQELNEQRREQEEIRLEHRRMEIACELAFQRKRDQQDEEALRRHKRIREERIAALQKVVKPKEEIVKPKEEIVKPKEEIVTGISPDDSTNSTRSFVSCCEELDPNMDEMLAKESEATSNLKHELPEKTILDEKQCDQQNSNVIELETEESLRQSDKLNSNEIEPEREGTPMEKNSNQSDQQNSNVIALETEETPMDAGMEMERNRQRNTCSDQFQDCQTEVQLQQTTTTINPLTDLECNRLRVLNCTDMQSQLPTDVNATTTTNPLTDLECNRLRVLNCTDMQTQLPTDVNMNLELTDMQRNRQRMQHHQHFGTLSNWNQYGKSEKSEANKSIPLSVGLQLSLEPHKLFVKTDLELDTTTPMSTTSDVEVETIIPNETVDAANNNVNESTHAEAKEEPSIKAPKPRPRWTVFDLKRPPVFQLQKLNSKSIGSASSSCHRQLPKDHNAFLIKRYVQQSIMVPLKTHLSLLRNEVLRIFDELDVYEHFCQLRNCFFLMDGEFGTMLINGILDRIESGMEPRGLCQKGALDAILNNALGHRATDGAGAAALFAENLSLTCTNIPESFDLMDISALSIFTLQCKVQWPLNLVISVETMDKYTQIFSHLLKLRHVSFMLERAFQHLQELGKLHGKALQVAPQYRHLQMVRHKLSHFVITLQNHLDTNALQGTWETFNDNLRNVDSVEGLYQRHVEYLKHIAFISLLNRKSVKFRETIDNILVIVLRFCKVLQSKPFVVDQNQEFIHPRYKRLAFEETEFEKFLKYVIYLGDKVDASGYQEKIVELIRIINFNRYYDVKIAKN